MRRLLITTAVATTLVATACGSSDEAASAHLVEVTNACIKASGFTDAKPDSQLILFDDSVGTDAMIVEGAYPQAHMKGQRGKMLCLFNKKSRTTVTSEIQSPDAVPAP